MKRLHTRELIVSGFRAHLRLRGMLLVIAAALMMGTLLAACGPAPVETQSTLAPTPYSETLRERRVSVLPEAPDAPQCG